MVEGKPFNSRNMVEDKTFLLGVKTLDSIEIIIMCLQNPYYTSPH